VHPLDKPAADQGNIRRQIDYNFCLAQNYPLHGCIVCYDRPEPRARWKVEQPDCATASASFTIEDVSSILSKWFELAAMKLCSQLLFGISMMTIENRKSKVGEQDTCQTQ
jgi:hypothetical protein